MLFRSQPLIIISDLGWCDGVDGKVAVSERKGSVDATRGLTGEACGSGHTPVYLAGAPPTIHDDLCHPLPLTSRRDSGLSPSRPWSGTRLLSTSLKGSTEFARKYSSTRTAGWSSARIRRSPLLFLILPFSSASCTTNLVWSRTE